MEKQTDKKFEEDRNQLSCMLHAVRNINDVVFDDEPVIWVKKDVPRPITNVTQTVMNWNLSRKAINDGISTEMLRLQVFIQKAGSPIVWRLPSDHELQKQWCCIGHEEGSRTKEDDDEWEFVCSMIEADVSLLKPPILPNTDPMTPMTPEKTPYPNHLERKKVQCDSETDTMEKLTEKMSRMSFDQAKASASDDAKC